MKRHEHLFFDLDNTLWDFTKNSRQALLQTLDNLNILPKLNSFDDYFLLYEQINHSLWAEYRSKRITKSELIIQRFSRSLEESGVFLQDLEGINKLYLENMALQTCLFPQTIETLSYLKAKDYQMYIVTNGFREVQRDKLRNCGLEPFFSRIFISEEIGTTKPHREIFEFALKTVNASKKKSIMIGDSWDIDIIGALSFGIDQVMFLNKGKNEPPPSISAKLKDSELPFLQLKHQTKTWFINEIGELVTIF